ncbi:hypothetical protein [Bacillus sp. AFS088145]|uniref:hypothetical protein n=1 Tax=Bacillus sp. AFS088145 TaxID=2033514 RepID=UPI000BF4C388|nr:hypothetical protein [Bacillus sp. AFS088145]PFH91396.1 hypothetical protein COI44_01970 [Bacillus sp. AFS088145]
MDAMKGFSFELSGDFAFFQWEKTKGDNRFTNLFVSKTDILGILGATIGLSGYVVEGMRAKLGAEKQPTFYEELGGLKIALVPLVKPSFFEDHLIHRHMMTVNAKGALQAVITGLVRPRYRIHVEQGSVSDDVFAKLSMYIKNGWSEYIPYLGKNQFPATIEKYTAETLVKIEEEEKIVSSLFLYELLQEEPDVDLIDLHEEDDAHYYIESLKFYEPIGTASIKNKSMVWSSFPVRLTESIYQTTTGDVVVYS